MDKKAVISRFLSAGKQLDAQSVEYFVVNPEKIDLFLGRTKGQSHKIITRDTIDCILGGSDIEIIKKFPIKNEKEAASISECSQSFFGFYESLKGILSTKVDSSKLLSINKIGNSSSFTLIVYVRDKDTVDKTADVEDMTGMITASFGGCGDFDDLREGDVVAVECVSNSGVACVSKVVWPDVPFLKTVEKSSSDAHVVFISDLHMDSPNFDRDRYSRMMLNLEKTCKDKKNMYIVVLGGVSSNKSDVEEFFSSVPNNTTKILIMSEKDANIDTLEEVSVFKSPVILRLSGVTMMLCQGDSIYRYKGVLGSNGVEIMKNILKRRDICPDAGAVAACRRTKDYIIDTTPSMFVSGSFHEPKMENYKGVTILTVGGLEKDPAFWSVDLTTREINKAAMS